MALRVSRNGLGDIRNILTANYFFQPHSKNMRVANRQMSLNLDRSEAS
jgi:hypothetical protein